MPFITIFTNLNERINALNIINQDIQNTTKIVLEDTGDLFVGELKKNVHVWEKRKFGPHMRDVIKRYPVSNNYVDVVVPTRYAQAENKRPGSKDGSPHNFADRSYQTTMQVMPQIIKTEFDQLFSRV